MSAELRWGDIDIARRQIWLALAMRDAMGPAALFSAEVEEELEHAYASLRGVQADLAAERLEEATGVARVVGARLAKLEAKVPLGVALRIGRAREAIGQ